MRIANKANKLLNVSQNQRWEEIASNIVILSFDKNITQEHSTYHGENVKQADVNLLSFPLKIILDKGQVSRDL